MPLSSPTDIILIGKIRKAFGLGGELKVTPQTDDPTRHEHLKEVFFQKHSNSEIVPLIVRQSRLHQGSWYLKFEKHNTPESLKYLSGGALFINKKDRLKLPDDKIYAGDLVGFQVKDNSKGFIGSVISVIDKPGQDLIEVKLSAKPSKPFYIPWVDVFVKNIDDVSKTVYVDTELLEGLA